MGCKKTNKFYFDSIIEFKDSTFLENIEIIILLNKVVCAVYPHNIGDYLYRIPFGLISANIDVIKKFQKYLKMHLENRLIVDVLDDNNENNKALKDIFIPFYD